MRKIKITVITLLTAVFILGIAIVAQAANQDCEYQSCRRKRVHGKLMSFFRN